MKSQLKHEMRDGGWRSQAGLHDLQHLYNQPQRQSQC